GPSSGSSWCPPGGRSWVGLPRYASAAPTARGRHRSRGGLCSGHGATPRAPARAHLPLLPSSPGGVQQDDTARGVTDHHTGSPAREAARATPPPASRRPPPAARRPRHPSAARPAASEPPRRAEGHDPATGSRKSPRSPGCPVGSLQHQVVTPVTPARDAKGVVASPTPGAFMIAELIDGANNLIWSIPLIVGLLIVGLYFTIRTRLLQIRNLPDMIDQ